MTPRYKFEQLDDGDNIEFGVSVESWPELADKFYDFLVGCGFSITRQALSDHFDQCVSYRTASNRAVEQANHAEAYGLDAPPREPDPEDDQYWSDERCADMGCGGDPIPPGPRLLGMKLYEFTVSDAYGHGIAHAWATARACIKEQQDFEIQSGGSEWPTHRLYMTDANVIDNAMVYNFEVQRV